MKKATKHMVFSILIIVFVLNACNNAEQVILCPEGTHLIGEVCELDETPICSCPEATHSENGACVLDEIPSIQCPEGMHLENEICEFDEPQIIETTIVCWDEGKYCENQTDYPIINCLSPDPWIFHEDERNPTCIDKVAPSEGSSPICSFLPLNVTCCSVDGQVYTEGETINCTGPKFTPSQDCTTVGSCITNNPCVRSMCNYQTGTCDHEQIRDGDQCVRGIIDFMGKEYTDQTCLCFDGQPIYNTEVELICSYVQIEDDGTEFDICTENNDDEMPLDCHNPEPGQWIYDPNTTPLCQCDDGSTNLPRYQFCCFKEKNDLAGECLNHVSSVDYQSTEVFYKIACNDSQDYCSRVSAGKCTSPPRWYYDDNSLPKCACQDNLDYAPKAECHIVRHTGGISYEIYPYRDCWRDDQCFQFYPCFSGICTENQRCEITSLENTNYCLGETPGEIDENCRCDEDSWPIYD